MSLLSVLSSKLWVREESWEVKSMIVLEDSVSHVKFNSNLKAYFLHIYGCDK